jgi:signal transduction histidine kinase
MTGQEVLAPASEAESLRQQLLQAQRLSSVGELASSVAHEFNNILTTIINFAKLGLRNQNPETQAHAFEKILRNGQRAAAIVNSMLGFARNHSVARVPTDIVELMQEVLLLTGKDLATHRIQVETRFPSKRVLAVVVPGQIEQILVNLVINARQAMPTGGRLRLEVRESSDGDTVEIVVADSGVGIAPENLRKIFDAFFTTKAPDEQGRGGTGLGLSVCRQIIEQHHGRIRVESVLGKGSTFIVKLPKRLPDDPGL